jgi:hypothetical protein
LAHCVMETDAPELKMFVFGQRPLRVTVRHHR